MLYPILIGLGAVIVLFLIVVALRPSDFRVSRSAIVDAPPSAVFPQQPSVLTETRLVHMDYLCTWIGRPI